MRKLFFILLISGFCAFDAIAQLTCTQRLNRAEDDYEAGRLLGIPASLDGCFRSQVSEGQDQFSKEEEIRARKLLTLVYIFTDQQSKSEQALINLLKADPEHRLDPRVDPAELFFLYDQFRSAPIFRIGLKAGINLTRVNVIQPYSTHNQGQQNTFYNGKEEGGIGEFQNGQGVGYNFEATIERHLFQGIEAITGVQWRISEYNVDNESIRPEDETETFNPLSTAITHEQMYLRFPLLFRYTYGYSNRDQIFLPYAFLGGGYDILLTSRYSNGERSPGTTYNTTEIDTKAFKLTRQNGVSLIGGLGTKIRIKTHFLTVQAQYNNSLMSYTRGENVYGIQESVFDLTFVEDEVSLDLFMFSIGWTQSIYKPEKLKAFRD